ncbi:MAG: acetylxylan esterase [Planctomycetota bacterium]
MKQTLLGCRALAILCLMSPAIVSGQANYDESKVPDYVLPDPLVGSDGRAITDAPSWRTSRRPELLDLFREQMYGHAPGRPGDMSFEQFDHDENALGGTAIRKQVRVVFSADRDGPAVDVLIYLPKSVQRPVPTFVGLNFRGNHTVHSDPAIRIPTSWMRNDPENGVTDHRASEQSRGVASSRWAIEKILGRGYALATAYYGDIDPDFDDGFQNGVHPLFYEQGQSEPKDDEWGSIAAWAWGLSRVMDYFETDPEIDHEHVAVMGHSRLGKTALWAGAQDERFGIVISNNSGCGGAALSRRRFGETVKRINTSFPHWFCDNFKQYNDNEDALPIDQHMLIALVAPRPVYVASANEDRWADPRGEFLSVAHAEPVYKLLGTTGFGIDEMPPVNQPVTRRMGYHVRTGGHNVTDFDWRCYMDFADRHFQEN